MALLESRPYRPFKSSEEYLEAMKEDLAEWLNTLYPELLINAEQFMDRLDSGIALCKHANYVRQAAEDYLARRQARNKSMTRSMTSGLAGPILAMGNVQYTHKHGTFFAKDNVSNFITWCRKSLKIIECLLFETDDLVMRKNEKHVILCLLEVARRGAKFGMLAPMLVQMERQIDREIAADNKANGIGCGAQSDTAKTSSNQADIGVGTDHVANETNMFDTDSENEEEDEQNQMLMYGPQPQIITNDLKSLDEMVRDLVEQCTCPSQFPMVRVSEGKYRIGDTKVLIFVRILRSHVMVRVGGGWDTLSHYLDKHDPCRCRAQHRAAVSARLIPRTNNQSNGIELHKAQVIFERSPPTAHKIISNFNNQATFHQNSSATAATFASQSHNHSNANLTPNYGVGNKQRSRSPTPQRKYLNQQHNSNSNNDGNDGSSTSHADKLHLGTSSNNGLLTSPNLTRRSMSPSPRRLIDMRKKQTSLDAYNNGPKSLTAASETAANHPHHHQHVQFDAANATQAQEAIGSAPASTNTVDATPNTSSSKFENISDNGSEISDEGYRSLGVIQSNAQKRESVHSQASMEDADSNARLEQTCGDSQHSSPADDSTISIKTPEQLDADFTLCEVIMDVGPQSLPAILSVPPPTQHTNLNDKFERSGIFITDDEITVDILNTTDSHALGFLGIDNVASAEQTIASDKQTKKVPKAKNVLSKIPRSPIAQRRRSSLDNGTCSGSLQELPLRSTALPIFSRKKPIYRSVRKPSIEHAIGIDAEKPKTTVRDVTNTWNGRTTSIGKKRSISTTAPDHAMPVGGTAAAANAFERNTKTRSSQILYDSNGRRIKGCTTASLTTSPVKSHASSTLAQQLLEAASSAKNDAQILEKMKTLLSRYSTSTSTSNTTTSDNTNKTAQTSTSKTSNSNKKATPAVYEDFTSAWVHSNGNLERSSSCSPPTKTLSKRSSAASSTESTHSRDLATAVSPRRERGMSKIPGPLRQHTELY